MKSIALKLLALGSLCAPALAHVEFQAFVVSNSGRAVDCAMCHTHSNGPDGTGVGQVGNLSVEELERLNRARAAFDPGLRVDSPILNEFGNLMVNRLGKRRILELRSAPAELAKELDQVSDLDDDGIPDAHELLAGTHPLINSDGDPWKLFVHNLKRQLFHVVMISLATAFGLYGLIHLLHGFAVRMRERQLEGQSGA